MTIASAIQKGHSVYVYDERGRQLAVIPGGSKSDDGLTGYTATTVSIRKGSSIYVYDERGRQKSVLSAR